MINLLLDKQIFAPSDARFYQAMCNDGRNICNFSLDMDLSVCQDWHWYLGNIKYIVSKVYLN